MTDPHPSTPVAIGEVRVPGRGAGRQGADSIVSGGCVISGALLNRSLLFSQVKLHPYAVVEESVVLLEVDIGRHCQAKRTVIDCGCRLPEGTVVGKEPETDAKRFRVTPKGIVLITPEMLGQEAHADE